jgi:uncharacterized protein (DUF433 family)
MTSTSPLLHIDPLICSGKPHVRGTRISVELLQGLAATDWTRENILGIYPYLKPEELEAALAYRTE